MKKLLIYLPYACFVMVLGAIGAFFARTREIYVGNLHYHVEEGHGHSVPLPNVAVHLYDANELRKWSNGDLLTSFLKWKSPVREREILDELLDLYESLETIYHPESEQVLLDSHRSRIATLGKYSVQLGDALFSTQAHFPWQTIKDLRNSIPDSLFHPTLSLMSHKKNGMEEPKTDNFFQYLADTFQDVSTFPGSDIHIQFRIREKIQNAEAGELVAYEPRFDDQEATSIIRQFYRIDKLAHTLQQFAVNDDAIIGTAPAPLFTDVSSKRGEVDFDIPRSFAKKYKDKTEFAVVAISMDQSVHPGLAFAWLKYIYLDQEAILPVQRLPFFPPKQQFIFSNDNAVATLLDSIQPQEKPDPNAPLPPLKFNRKPAQENLFNALALLFAKKRDYLHGHAGGHSHADDHSHKENHGSSHDSHSGGDHTVHSSHSTKGVPLPSADFEMFDVPLLDAEQPVPVEVDERDFELFDGEILPLEEAPVTPSPGNTAPGNAVVPGEKEVASSQDADFTPPTEPSPIDPAILENALVGSWYNQDEQRSFRFSPAGSFTMMIEQEEILFGFYRLPEDSPHQVLSLTNKSDGLIYHALFKFLTRDTIRIELGSPNSPPSNKFSEAASVFRRTQ